MAGIHALQTLLLLSATSWCRRCSVVLYVDNVKVGEARMPATAAVIDDMLGDAGGLYIGGVPEDGDFDGLAASLEPLTPGCISQLMIND